MKTKSLPISRYLTIDMAYFPGFLGDGATVTFLSNLTGIPQLWQVAAERGPRPFWPRQLTVGGNRLMGAWPAPGPGRRLLFARDAGGDENAQLFLLDPETGREQMLTAGHEAAMHIFGCWSEDGSAFTFAANRRHPAHFDIYRHQLETGASELLWQHDEPGFLINFTLAGRRLAFTRVRSSFDNDLFLLDLERGEARQLSPPDARARYTALAYAPGGRTLYVVTDLESDFLHLRRLEPATRTWETIVAPNWDVEHMALSGDGRYLAYTVNVDGAGRLELIDMATGTGRPGPDMGAAGGGAPGVVGMFDGRLAFSPSGRALAFSYTSAARASDVYVWQIETDEMYPVTRAGHGGLPRERFVAPALVRYPTFDERQIPAYYFRPEEEDGRPLPTVVIVHGGPESQYRPYFNFLAQYLVHSGYAVLAPNVRGSTGYGKGYSHLDDVEKRMDSVADLAHAARWLAARPEIDPGRIAVYGGSYGGFMVLAALTAYPDLWAAGVDIVGISNFVTFLENTSDYRRAHREAEYGSLDHDHAFLESIAPVNHLEQIEAPLLVIHGANDPRVPLSEAEQLAGALQARDVPVRLLVFDDEGHGIVKLENKKVAYPAVVDFLDEHLEQNG